MKADMLALISAGREAAQPWSAAKTQNPRLRPPSRPVGTTVVSTRQKTSQSVDMTSLSGLGSVNTPGASLDQTTLAYGPKYWQQVGPPGSRFGQHTQYLRSPLAKRPTQQLANSPCKCQSLSVSNALRLFCASRRHQHERVQLHRGSRWAQHRSAWHAGQSAWLPRSSGGPQEHQ